MVFWWFHGEQNMIQFKFKILRVHTAQKNKIFH